MSSDEHKQNSQFGIGAKWFQFIDPKSELDFHGFGGAFFEFGGAWLF